MVASRGVALFLAAWAAVPLGSGTGEGQVAPAPDGISAGTSAPDGISAGTSARFRLDLTSAGRVVAAWAGQERARGKAHIRVARASADLSANGSAVVAESELPTRTVANGSAVADGLWHWAELPELAQGSTYYYQVSAAANRSEFGPVRQLRMPRIAPSAKAPVRLAIVGELYDDATGRAAIAKIAEGLTETDVVVQMGARWATWQTNSQLLTDKFFAMISPLTFTVPYLTVAGPRAEARATDDILLPIQGQPWYSLTLGRARFIMLWTEVFLSRTGSGDHELAKKQLAWLTEELALGAKPEERRERPWVIVFGHQPLYCSMQEVTCSSEAVVLRSQLERLFRKYRVDMYLSAHVNAYERTFPVFNRTLCPHMPRKMLTYQHSPCAPVYVVNGDVGSPPLQYGETSVPAAWTAQRHAGSGGFGVLTVHNATHLQYEQREAESAESSDEVWLIHHRDSAGGFEEEENFLEAVSWLGFATAVIGSTMGFVRWAHGDGMKSRDQALRELRLEMLVLSGASPEAIAAATEACSLKEDSGPSGLH